MTLTHYHPTVTHDPFEHQMEREFVVGSGIQPTLYQAATRLVEDTELFAGGEVHYDPDALPPHHDPRTVCGPGRAGICQRQWDSTDPLSSRH